MGSQLHPDLIELVYDAALRSFWRKEALRKFLRECSIKESFISSWSEGERKRDFLDRLFRQLQTTDAGRGAVLRMAGFLSTKREFPDLAGWEESERMVRDARDAVARLAGFLREQEEAQRDAQEVAQSRKRLQEIRDKALRSKHDLASLADRLNELVTRIGTAKAGYDFEEWVFDLLDYSEIVNRRPYMASGRQIDGALTTNGTTYLVELKFTLDLAGAPDVDSFFKKVTKTADNTMGIMISFSGYTSIAVQEASGSRTPLLLLDHGHIFRVLTGASSMEDVIDRVRRHASQTGESYLPASKF